MGFNIVVAQVTGIPVLGTTRVYNSFGLITSPKITYKKSGLSFFINKFTYTTP